MDQTSAIWPKNTAEVIQLLESRNIMPSKQRIQIAEVLLTKAQHISADSIIQKLASRGISVSKATIYNTLSVLEKNNLVRPIVVNTDHIVYDSNTIPHQHFYNLDTGELVDIDPYNIRVDHIPNPPENTKIQNMDIVIHIRNTK